MAMLVLMVCLGFVPPAVQGSGDAPAVLRPRRLVHLFDFEERHLGNYEDLPMHWYVIGRPALTSDPNFHLQPVHQALVGRPGFPAYTQVRFSRGNAWSGDHSFFLGLNGGNAGAFLEVGTLAAVPSSDYLISAMVRTEGLSGARARMIGYFLDANGRIIESSRSASAALDGTRAWEPLTLKLHGEFMDAAWIGLQLEVQQPVGAPDNPLGPQQVVLQDVHGGAWFDDIGVWQLPHVDLSTQSAVGIVRGPDRPYLKVDVRDLTGRRLRAELTAYDHSYAVIDRVQRTVGAGAPMAWRWTPTLTHYGWYLFDLQIHEDTGAGGVGGLVARSLAAALWLPEITPLAASDRGRFGVAAEDVPDEELALAPALLEAADLHRIVLSAWARETTAQTLDARQALLDETLRRVLARGGSAVLSLHPIPQALAGKRGVEAWRPLGVLQGDRSEWLPYLAPVMMRHGQRVSQWQLGTDAQTEAFLQRDLTDVLARVNSDFRSLAPNPQVLLPWAIHEERRSLPPGMIAAMHVPPSVPAEALGSQLQDWRAGGTEYWLYLQEPAADQVLHSQRAIDLALRMIHGWEAEASGLMLPRPWTRAGEGNRLLWPDPLLGVFTNVARHLSGRRVIGRLPLQEGLEALVLDGERGGLIVAWAHGSAHEDRTLHLYLGEEPVAYDIWGNASGVPLEDRGHRVSLTESPLFISGINADLARFRASFQVEPAFIESKQAPQEVTLVLRNPWPRTINGTLRLTGPANWSLQPPRHMFSLSPDQEMRLPVRVSFPLAELAGPKHLTAQVEFAADRQYSVDLAAPMELGMTDLEFEATLALRPSAKTGLVDAEILCVLTNNGETPKALSLFAQLRHQARQDRVIGNLQPGQSIVRRFRFTDLSPEDREAPLRTGVRELSGPAVLNRTLPLDAAR